MPIFSQQEDGAQAGEYAQRKGERKIQIQVILTKEGEESDCEACTITHGRQHEVAKVSAQ